MIEVRVHGRFESNYGEALRDAALAGLGIALHSVWHVHEDLRAGRLKVALPDHLVPVSGFHAVMPGWALVPLRVRAFVDYLRSAVGEGPRALTGAIRRGAISGGGPWPVLCRPADPAAPG